jgi:hypothetical protein
MSIEWRRLTEPFPATDVEWRIGQAGKSGEKVWAKVLAYITARAIQERLDEVFGPGGWKNEYRAGPNGGLLCRIYFKNDEGEWVWREDGAENTDIEAVKGGISGATKRAGSALGIGRYLYRLEEGFAETSTEKKRGWNYARLPKDKGGDAFYWIPPELPAWALPAVNQHGEPLASEEQIAELRKLAGQKSPTALTAINRRLSSRPTETEAAEWLDALRADLNGAATAGAA